MIEIEIIKLSKTYSNGKVDFQALTNVDMKINKGELIGIVGPSGCGKSTILNMITGIDRPTKGMVIVNNKRIHELSENQLAKWRGKNIGIVFQFFQLLPTLTSLENVILPMDLARNGNIKQRKETAKKNLELVGLEDKLRNLPSELSGGEQQRVAIARAMVNDAKIIIADEPTGNLDSMASQRIFDIFMHLNKQGKTVIYATHDKNLASKAKRVITVIDGKLQNDNW